MRRYITRPAAPKGVSDDFDWSAYGSAQDSLSRTVFEADRTPRRTGLLNAHGQDLYAVDEMPPIGFVHWKDRA